MYHHAFKKMALLALSAAIAACNSSSDTPVTPTITDVTIPFQAEANGQPIECDIPLAGLGTLNTTATLQDFRFYLHDLAVTTSLGLSLIHISEPTRPY